MPAGSGKWHLNHRNVVIISHKRNQEISFCTHSHVCMQNLREDSLDVVVFKLSPCCGCSILTSG
jgi:hypothetical protein